MIASLRPIHHLATVSSKTPHRSSPRVLVLTDGSIESAIKAVSLGKQLANGPHHLETKTVVANKVLDLFPPILQKYWVDWAFRSTDTQWPWYLMPTHNNKTMGPITADYLICSGVSAIPACLYVKKHQSKKIFSVFLGYPIIPFIHFDQVVLPKYEANAKMAALGPLARQRNCILTEHPLLDPQPLEKRVDLQGILPASLSNNPTSSDLTTVVVGGYASECRWYSEDAVTLVDILKRTILHLKTHLVIVFTEKTTPMVKDVIRKGIDQLEKEQRESVSIWDSMLSKDTHTTLERVDMYESLIAKSNRIITTADLDYLTAHASSRRKPVYVAFDGRCRSFLQQFQHRAREMYLTRKLRLDRTQPTSTTKDPYSYLGHPPPFADGPKVLKIQSIIDYVQHEIEAIRHEKATGKRRKDQAQ